MNRTRPNLNKPDRTLYDVLSQAHLRVVLISVLLVGSSSFAIGLIALRTYMIDNLELVARSTSYTLEAALVFRDQAEAAESLARISENNSVAEAEVVDSSGRDFAVWYRDKAANRSRVEEELANLLLPAPISGAIVHDGKSIGEVRLYPYGQDLMLFLMISVGSLLLCILPSSYTAFLLSRRAGHEIINPLRQLAETAHAARRERQFFKRVAPAKIAELNELGDDFNALLMELEAWQAQVKEENASLTYQATHDPLTGLYNRASFERELKTALDHARHSGDQLAVFFIDANRFKAITDKLGHDVGDEVHRCVATRLRSQLRDKDIVARGGGDEFAILLTALRDVEHAIRIAANIMAAMEEPIPLASGHHLNAALSIGIAFFPEHGETAAALVKRADSAMYQAKHNAAGAYFVANFD